MKILKDLDNLELPTFYTNVYRNVETAHYNNYIILHLCRILQNEFDIIQPFHTPLLLSNNFTTIFNYEVLDFALRRNRTTGAIYFGSIFNKEFIKIAEQIRKREQHKEAWYIQRNKNFEERLEKLTEAEYNKLYKEFIELAVRANKVVIDWFQDVYLIDENLNLIKVPDEEEVKKLYR